MRAIGYFRIAGKGGSREGLPDLVEQEKAFLSFCQQQGFEPAATFVEQGREGEDESQFERLLAYVERPDRGFIVVVVQRPEMLGGELASAIARLLELSRKGVRVVAADEPEAEPFDRLLAGWSAKKAKKGESGHRITEAMKARAMMGEVLGRPPFGYRVGPNRRLEREPAEAAVVETIYRLHYENGYGLRRIARHLNEQQIATKAGKTWSVVAVRDVLRNRVYTGTYSRFGIQIPGSHPAIIPHRVFATVQERLKGLPHKEERAVSAYLLSGLLYCGRCGRRMIGVRRHPRWKRSDGSEGHAEYRYYQCQSRANHSVCDYNTQPTDKLEAKVLEALTARGASSGGGNTSAGGSLEDERRRLSERLRELQERFAVLLDETGAGNLSRRGLEAQAGSLAAEEHEVRQRLRLLSQGVAAETSFPAEDMTGLEARWQRMNMDERRALLRQAIERITVDEDNVEFAWRRDNGES